MLWQESGQQLGRLATPWQNFPFFAFQKGSTDLLKIGLEPTNPKIESYRALLRLGALYLHLSESEQCEFCLIADRFICRF